MFAYNLQNYAHYTKLNTAKLSTAGGYRYTLPNNNTLVPVPQNDLIDLNAIKFGGSSNSLPDDVRRYRTNNRLYIACG